MTQPKNINMNRGAAILTLIFALLFFVLIIRFLYLQTTGEVNGEILAARAQEQYERKRSIEASRGAILDRKGEVIAQDTSTYTLVAVLDDSMTTSAKNPKHVVEPEETAEKLAPLLEMEESEVEKIITKDAFQVEFGPAGRNISHELKVKIEKMKLPGIAFTRDTHRYYPNGTFASHIIGYAQKDEKTKNTVGMFGIEKSLDKYLQDNDGYKVYEADKQGFTLPNGDEKIVAPENGNTVHLTLDQKVQTFLEDAMNEAAEEYEPEKIIGIVADPKTGKILAMGQRPSFDPNVRDINNYYNDAVAYPFEPGSTMKIFTLAAAIEEGVFNRNELYQSGAYKVEGGRIRDHNKTGWGTISFLEGVQRSSNVAMAILAKEKLGPDRFMQYMNKFGLNEKTGIDLPNEANGKFNYKYDIEKVTTAFGQGSTVTPIQQVQAATAIANGGKMMKPYIIDKIVDVDHDKVIKQNKPEVAGTPISEKTSKEVLDILETVVSSEKGTGRPYQIEGYEVAGKTGTAQIPGSDGKYLSGRDNFIFSFLGMAPKEDPELLVYVAVQQPKLKDTETGSMPVSSVFNTVMKNSLQYLKIQPSEEAEEQPKKTETEIGAEVPSFVGENPASAEKWLKSNNIHPLILGSGNEIAAQYPEAGTKMIVNERVLLKTDGKVIMPDLKGWSSRDVMKLANFLDLNLKINGNGYVVSQNLSKNETVNENDQLIVKLESPEQPSSGGNEQADEEEEIR
ncbi:penicillin-binding protein [Metabacillus idriensis]|uniref:penicillin-binding protein n=1 Tax=Metabacillus idriensis TaxID=324768 RepID=UPI0008A92F47|nr:penicillin-binding protein [Metabacillus idriensis]MCM3594410.1 penicillin-binding protein [Metabacillus idriensis]OHR72905.1 penicillin-binding protein [Bacillus sp. HMSC76G11]